MFCVHCGHRNDDGARFCGTCGSPTGDPGPTPAAPPAQKAEWWTQTPSATTPRHSATETIDILPPSDAHLPEPSPNELPTEAPRSTRRFPAVLTYATAGFAIALVLVIPRISAFRGIIRFFPAGAASYDGPLKAISWFITLAAVAVIATRIVADQSPTPTARRGAWISAGAVVLFSLLYALRSIQLWSHHAGSLNARGVEYILVSDVILVATALLVFLGTYLSAKEVVATHDSDAISPATRPTNTPRMPANVVHNRATNGLAVVSLVLSLFYLGGLGSLLGVIFGHVARGQVRRSQGTQEGGGLALAGIVIGYVGLIGAVAFWILIVAFARRSNSGTY